ncbi:cytochrome c [Flavobacterium piscis]|uniref:Mono/diheme cytochrome c family protein n=1 Tax=Flavobacterium piscis TaxID=1114874 RepID=A0ABU1YER6_9FLAO|nr:cytochrome c [Flavobacterium piscis]MDR7211906.1 mono/diheme cytochrome c family protein [Flavobacterium piscis]
MKKIIALTILLAAFASCSDSDTFQDIETPPETGTPPPGPDPVVTISYSKNVKSIIDGNCIGCHQSGRSAAFRPLTTYAEVKAAVENAGLLNRIQLQNGQQGLMPQGGRMSQANIDLIVKWNTDGLKED